MGAAVDAVGPIPTAGGAVTGPKPLGVPEDYVAHRRDDFNIDGPVPGTGIGGPISGRSEAYDVTPQYTDGMQYSIANMDPVQLSALQASMRNAGLLDADYVSGYGSDPATIAAMAQLMSEANASGYTIDQTLQRRLAAPQVAQKKAAKAPFTASAYLKPDPATLKESVRGLMKSVIGPDREPTEAELDDLTSRLGGMDRQAYDASTAADQANYNADASGVGGGATVDNVDPSARLTDYLRTAYKPEIDMTKRTTDLAANRDGLLGSVFAIDKAIASPGL